MKEIIVSGIELKIIGQAFHRYWFMSTEFGMSKEQEMQEDIPGYWFTTKEMSFSKEELEVIGKALDRYWFKVIEPEMSKRQGTGERIPDWWSKVKDTLVRFQDIFENYKGD